MQYHLRQWPDTFKNGDCSINSKISKASCRFTHSWLPDEIDPWRDLDTLTDGLGYAKERLQHALYIYFGGAGLLLVVLGYGVHLFLQKKSHSGKKKSQ